MATKSVELIGLLEALAQTDANLVLAVDFNHQVAQGDSFVLVKEGKAGPTD